MPRTAAQANPLTGQLSEPLAPGEECPLSLMPLDPEHAVYVTPCGHVFSDDDPYLRGLMGRATCPLCRRPIGAITRLGSCKALLSRYLPGMLEFVEWAYYYAYESDPRILKLRAEMSRAYPLARERLPGLIARRLYPKVHELCEGTFPGSDWFIQSLEDDPLTGIAEGIARELFKPTWFGSIKRALLARWLS